VDPGHGGTAETDHFRVGPGGEREEWINLRVALVLQELLQARGAQVLMTRTEDVHIELADRARLAVEQGADAFVSIHHNGTADPAVNFPIIYFHGAASENQASVRLGRLLAERLSSALFHGKEAAWLVSDHAIFPTAGANVLRNSYGIPGVIGEASFFTNPEEEQRLRQPEANRAEAEAYFEALEAFFADDRPPIAEKGSMVELPPFEVLQEGERMEEEAMLWRANHDRGLELLQHDPPVLEEALEYFTRSARAFPDSPVAHACHRQRAMILEQLGRTHEAETARLRAAEHYVRIH
jgi:N-acetylmuramoyl-L-alanine amidase